MNYFFFFKLHFSKKEEEEEIMSCCHWDPIIDNFKEQKYKYNYDNVQLLRLSLILMTDILNKRIDKEMGENIAGQDWAKYQTLLVDLKHFEHKLQEYIKENHP